MPLKYITSFVEKLQPFFLYKKIIISFLERSFYLLRFGIVVELKVFCGIVSVIKRISYKKVVGKWLVFFTKFAVKKFFVMMLS